MAGKPSNQFEIGFSVEEFVILGVIATVISLIVYLSFSSIDAFRTSSQLVFPANLASIASSVSTLLLVILTGWYTLETRRMVNVEQEKKSIERVEDWYRQVFTEARILHRSWENIIESQHFPKSDEGYNVEEEILQDMTERVESLLELYGSCPSKVPDETRDLLSQLYSDWHFTRTGGDWTYLPENHNAKNSLDELMDRIEEESRDYGN